MNLQNLVSEDGNTVVMIFGYQTAVIYFHPDTAGMVNFNLHARGGRAWSQSFAAKDRKEALAEIETMLRQRVAHDDEMRRKAAEQRTSLMRARAKLTVRTGKPFFE